MSVVVVLAGLALLALPGIAAPTASRLPASEWTRLNRGALRMGLWAVQVGLVLTAAPTVLRAAGFGPMADACHRLLSPIVPGGPAAGWMSTAAGVALGATSSAARRRSRRLQRSARIDSWLGEHEQVPGATLVVLPTDAVVAYATPGRAPQVVLSSALVETLNPDELAAVVRHELAHLRNRHHRDLTLASAIDAALGWLPGPHASTDALRLSIERCADEEAAQPAGGRESLQRALLKATETMLGPLPAFSAAFTLLARLEALGASAPKGGLGHRVAVIAPVAGLAMVVAASLLAWVVYTHHSVIGLVGFCPA